MAATATTAPTPLPALGGKPVAAGGAATNPLPAFLRLIAAVNKGVGAVEREGLVPLTLKQSDDAAPTIIGHVRPSFVPTLLEADAPSGGGGGALLPPGGASPPPQLQVDPRLAAPADRTASFAKTAAALRDRGVVTGWRDEPYPIFGDGAAWTPAPGGALFEVERAVVPWLGARAFGVHINGYVSSPGRGGGAADGGSSSSSSSSRRRPAAGPAALWVARRSRSKPTWPGMLDHLAAGGQPAGMGATANAVKEAWEEAGVPEALCRGGGGEKGQAAGGLRPVGTVTYRGLSSEGLKPDTLFVYDLELPADFTPEPQDGEVEAFELWSVERVVEALAEAGRAATTGASPPAAAPRYPAFKPNVAVVMIDFLVRHGFVGPDTGPEYAEVVARLRQ